MGIAEFPRTYLSPSKDVDMVWHEHIADTENYAADCKRMFGHFVHHRPGRVGSDQNDPADGYDDTKRLYVNRFGVEPPAEFWDRRLQRRLCGFGGGSSACEEWQEWSVCSNWCTRSRERTGSD